MSSVYANFKSFEGTVNGHADFEFPWKARVITIVNDSASEDLEFQFNHDDNWATLRARETVQFEIWSREVHLRSSNLVGYRVWGIG